MRRPNKLWANYSCPKPDENIRIVSQKTTALLPACSSSRHTLAETRAAAVSMGRGGGAELDDGDYEGIEKIARRMRILLPNSWFRSTWDWVLICFVLYDLINIPLEICFVYEKPVSLQIFNYVVDVAFICDMALNFRTAFYEGIGLSPVIKKERIAKFYVFGPSGKSMGWFWPDLIASVPFPQGSTLPFVEMSRTVDGSTRRRSGRGRGRPRPPRAGAPECT